MDVSAFTQDIEARSLPALEDELLTLNAHLGAAAFRFLCLVREFDRRQAWGGIGMRSMAHWLNWRCGMSLGAAREQVRVAHALSDLPLLSQALAEGRVSFSKVRAISRVASPGTEAFFLNVAEYSTASQLEKVVRITRHQLWLDAPDRVQAMLERCRCDWFFDDEGMLVMRARLMPDDGARLVKAVQAFASVDASDQVPSAARRAIALADVAQAACSDGSGSGIAVPQIVVHVPAHVSAETSEGEVGPAYIDDEVAIPTATAHRLACDAAVVVIHEGPDGEPLSVGRRTRTIPPAISRALDARDKGCRFPGCSHTRFLHRHHIKHWANRGETSLKNLVTLCTYHHTLIHEGGYTVERRDDGSFVFFTPRGAQVSTNTPTRSATITALTDTHANLNLDVSAETCANNWTGECVDYDLVLTALFSTKAGQSLRPVAQH